MAFLAGSALLSCERGSDGAGAAEVWGGVDALSPSDRALFDRLAGRAREVFDGNRWDSDYGPFHLPSVETYRAFFAWDSGWNIIALSVFDPELAYQELNTVFATQGADGRVPHEVRIPGLEETDPLREIALVAVQRQYDDSGRSAFVDPPSFLIAAEVLYRRTGDARVLALLPAMQRSVDYLLGSRDLFGDGLVSIVHPWESGTDGAPVFDEAMGIDISSSNAFLDYLLKYTDLLNHCADLDWDPVRIGEDNSFVFEDVGFNAITATGLVSMAALYEADGQPDKAETCRQRARGMVQAIETFLWDEEAGFFFPRWNPEDPQSARRRCLTGLAPLMTGLVDPDKAARVIEGALDSEAHFRAEHLVPFSSVSEIEDEIPAEDTVLWRGHCIWANMNWIAARAAAACGRSDLARTITRATADMVDEQDFREFYDSRTGAGAGAPTFTWPALVLDMIDEYGL